MPGGGTAVSAEILNFLPPLVESAIRDHRLDPSFSVLRTTLGLFFSILRIEGHYGQVSKAEVPVIAAARAEGK